MRGFQDQLWGKSQCGFWTGWSGKDDEPRKVARIFAAFSASPGKLKPCAKDCDDDCTRLEPSFKNVEAWMPALTAPFLNLSSIDIVEGNRKYDYVINDS
jgi:hypothetical protein